MNVGRAIHDRKQEVGSWTCTGSWSQRVRCFFFGGMGGGEGDTAFFGGGDEGRGRGVIVYYSLKKTDQNSCSSFLEQTFNN